jgi:O-antigen ligase
MLKDSPLERTAFIIFLITLALSPLLFGAVHTYAYTIMSLGVFTGSLLLIVKNIIKDPKGKDYQFQFPNNSLTFLFVILLVFLIFQVTPLPDSLIKFISPEAYIVRQKSIPASSSLISESLITQWISLSPYFYPVRMSIIRWTVYGLFFLGLTQILNSQKRIEIAIFLVLVLGCFEALYGLVMTYSGYNHIWWFKKLGDNRDVTGTYINRNHFAGLMEMCVLVAISYAAALSDRKKARNMLASRKANVRARLSRYLSMEQRFNKRALILFAGVVMGIGLVFSASRGGIISVAGAMLCISLLIIFRKNHRRKGFIVLALFLVASIYALFIGVEYPVERFKDFDTSLQARARYAKRALDIFHDYQATGIGIGNFQYAYPKYQSAQDKDVFLRYAHNDWAQFFAEAGVIGFCLLVVGVVYYIYRTLKLWRIRTDSFAICLGVTPLAAMTAMAIHSYSDFNLHIPANFLMFSAIIAIGYSALHLERRHGKDKSFSRYHIIPLKYKGGLVLLLVLGLILWNGLWAVRHFMAEAYCNTVTNSTLNRDKDPPVEEIKQAIVWDSWNAEYWYNLARKLRKMREKEKEDLKLGGENRYRFQRDIISALEKAVRLNPLKAEYHIQLGWEYASMWKDPDFYRKWLPSADISMDRAAYLAGEKNPYLHVHLGNYWIFRSKTTYPSQPEWESAWSNAGLHYRRAQDLEKSKDLARKIANFIWRYYPDKDFIAKILTADNMAVLEEME